MWNAGTRHITRSVYNMGSLLGPPPSHTHTKRYNRSVVYRVHTRQSICYFSTVCVRVLMILSCTNICFPSTAGILLILGSQIVSASQMVIEEAFLKSRALHPLHVCIQITVHINESILRWLTGVTCAPLQGQCHPVVACSPASLCVEAWIEHPLPCGLYLVKNYQSAF